MRTTPTSPFVIIAAAAAATTASADVEKPRDVRRHVVTRSSLGTGAEPTSAASRYIRGDAGHPGVGCADDDAGHIVARNLGGSGRPENMFPQSSSVNRGDFARWEATIAAAVAAKDDRDVDHDGDTNEFVHAYVELDVWFEYGDRQLEARPTFVNYCFTPYYTDDLKRSLGRDREDRECRRFANPKSSLCTRDQEAIDDWDELVEEGTAHLQAMANLRDPAKFLTKRDRAAIAEADIERPGGPEFRRAETIVAAEQRKIAGRWNHERDAYKQLIARFRPYEKIAATATEATAWRKRLEQDAALVEKAVAAKLRPFIDNRARPIFDHNVKQHEKLQSDKKCDISHDGGSSEPDCVDFETCTVWEFYPAASRDTSKKRSTAIGHANRLDEKALERSHAGRKSAWIPCFQPGGPTRGKGFEGKAAAYPTFR